MQWPWCQLHPRAIECHTSLVWRLISIFESQIPFPTVDYYFLISDDNITRRIRPVQHKDGRHCLGTRFIYLCIYIILLNIIFKHFFVEIGCAFFCIYLEFDLFNKSLILNEIYNAFLFYHLFLSCYIFKYVVIINDKWDMYEESPFDREFLSSAPLLFMQGWTRGWGWFWGARTEMVKQSSASSPPAPLLFLFPINVTFLLCWFLSPHERISLHYPLYRACPRGENNNWDNSIWVSYGQILDLSLNKIIL